MSVNLELSDLMLRVANLEKHVELLYDENTTLKLRQRELEECNSKIGKRAGLDLDEGNPPGTLIIGKQGVKRRVC